MAVTAAGLVLILQEIADPSPLFFTVPWEALEFVLSPKVRANHFWLHRTQDLLRASGDSLAKIDGCATRDGFFLIGAAFNEAQIQWASQSAWRATCQKPSAKEPATGCKTIQFLLALGLIAGGFAALSLFRGVDLGSGLLLCALCGAAGRFLARPAEKALGPWTGRVARSNKETWPNRLEVGESRDPAVPVVQEESGFPCAANAGAGVERGLNQMSVRSRFLAAAEKQISNPFLLCALVSLRMRQHMMTGNVNTSTAQLVDSALNELIAGVLEFERGKPRRPPLIRTESRTEESDGGLETPGVRTTSPTLSAEAP